MSKQIIGYVSDSNPFSDKKAWSGTLYKIREAIENSGFDVRWIRYNSNFQNSKWEKLRKKIMTIFNCNILGGVHYYPLAKKYADSIDSSDLNKCNYIFFPKDGQIGLFLHTDIPIIYYADATVYKMIDFYWFNIPAPSQYLAKMLEKKASQKAIVNLRSSHWAINSVISDCHCPINSCYVLEYGANIDEKDIKPITPYTKGTLNMLFSGVDWNRKGGDVAVRTMLKLRSSGLDTILHIVGINELPDEYKDNPFIILHGFLNKNKPLEYQKYINIWKSTHIFILPTKAECSAIVYCEAAAFGVPCYTYNTGGTSDYVLDNVNGRCISLNKSSEDYSNFILSDINNHLMNMFHQNALELYEEKLSWHSWSIRFRHIMDLLDINQNSSSQ